MLGVDPARRAAMAARMGVVLQGAPAKSQRPGDAPTRLLPAPARPAEVLAAVGLTEQAGIRVGRLSGGQRRRLDVALGVSAGPSWSSSTSRPPAWTRPPGASSGSWSATCGGGTTMLLTTHYLDEADELADRVGVIAGGRLVEVAPRPSSAPHRAATVSWRDDGGRRGGAPPRRPRSCATCRRVPRTRCRAVVTRPRLEDVYLKLIGDPGMTTIPADSGRRRCGASCWHPGRGGVRGCSSVSATRWSSRCRSR